MSEAYLNLTAENLDKEHLCCAISDKKHQAGVCAKKAWLRDRLAEGQVFRKLDDKGKVFIEYAPLESAWVPVEGENYLYIYCLWVSGSFSGKGHAAALLQYCLDDARAQGKAGVCVLSAKKKTPFLSDKKFFLHHGFSVVDTAGKDYELLALRFDNTPGQPPRFTLRAKQMQIDTDELTIYFSPQCPYIPNCVEQVKDYCAQNNIPLTLLPVDTLEKAKVLPCVFNNWAVFRHGVYQTNHLLNETVLKKKLGL